MPTLTQQQIRMYAAAAGLPDPDKMAAIAMAESSGRTDVVNSIGCVGLWQINQPVHVGSHPTWTVSWLKDPAHNAQAAKAIYDSQGYAAWESYTGPDGTGSDGPWQRYADGSDTSGGGTADAGQADFLEKIPGVSDVMQVASEVGRIAQATAKAANWISDPLNWLRIGYVAAGGVLLALGVTMAVKGQALTVASKTVGGALAAPVKKVGKR